MKITDLPEEQIIRDQMEVLNETALAREADLEWLTIDSAIVRVRGWRAKPKGGRCHVLGRSRGDQSTRIHAAGDAFGNPFA